VLVVDSPDRLLTRRIGQIVDSSVPSSWIGRQAPRLFHERGLEQVTAVPHLVTGPYNGYKLTYGGTLDQAVRNGQLSAEELAGWWKELEQAEQRGQFFGGLFGFIVYGRKPV
jgi:hypothetical protein